MHTGDAPSALWPCAPAMPCWIAMRGPAPPQVISAGVNVDRRVIHSLPLWAPRSACLDLPASPRRIVSI